MKIALISKSELLEKLGWGKRFASLKDDAEKIQKARIALKLNYPFMLNAADAALDSLKIQPKLKDAKLNMPSAAEVDVMSSKIIREAGIYAIFTQFERIPGKVEFRFGIGYFIETFNIFLASSIYKTVDVIETRKKFGFMKEEHVTKEQKLKSPGEIFGNDFASEDFRAVVTAKEKDNEGNLRYGVKMIYNLNGASDSDYLPDKLSFEWKDAEEFLAHISHETKKVEFLLNSVYSLIGYDIPPTHDVIMGDVSSTLKVNSIATEDRVGIQLLDVICE